MFINPKPRSDWRKGDKTVFDKRKGSRSVSEKKGDYRSNVSQQSHLANSNIKNVNYNNNNVCYTENSSSGNNYNNDITCVDYNRGGNYSDVTVHNMHVQNTMPHKSHYENNYNESYQNPRHMTKDSGVSKSQNFESN